MSGVHGDHGPVQAVLVERLAAAGIAGVEVGLADRSPLAGEPAFRVRATDLGRGEVDSQRVRAPEVGEALRSWPEVEAVAVRPPQVYLRLTTDALRRWALTPRPDRAVSGQVRALRLARPPAGPELDAYRIRAVATALARVHEARGDRAVIVDRHDPVIADPLAVGAVEVPHGPLRARHGGSVDADDLLAELTVRWGDAAEAVLRLVMLRTRGPRRLRLDDERLDAAAAEWFLIAAPPTGRLDDAGTRRLAYEIERVPANVAQAARRADPAPVAGALLALSRARRAGDDDLARVADAHRRWLARLLDVPAPAA